ncbi:MAG: DUF2946 family protein [Caulobacter sp.]
MSARQPLKRASRLRLWPALAAALALLVQSLAPGAAMAMERFSHGEMRTMVICSAEGMKTVSVRVDNSGEHQRRMTAMTCHACLLAAITAIEPPQGPGVLVRYGQIIRLERERPALPRALVRHPPRPFGQGPPATFDI